MKLTKYVFAVLLACVFSTTAIAQTKQGATELQLFGNIETTEYKDSDDVDTIDINIGYGYYVSDALKLGGVVAWSKFGDDFEVTALGGSATYHFNTASTTVPYVGAELLMVAFDTSFGDDDSFAYDIFAGVKYFISENANIFAQLHRETWDDDAETTNTGLEFGVSLLF